MTLHPPAPSAGPSHWRADLHTQWAALRWPRGGDAVVTLLALLMALTPGLGVPHELLLQDTFKSMLVAGFALSAGLLLCWQQSQRGLQNQAWHWHPLLGWPLALLLYALGSMVWSHTYLAAVEAVRWFVWALLLWVGMQTLERERLPTLAQGIHWGAVLAAMWVGLQFWLDVRWFPQAAVPGSTFSNRNFVSEFLVCTLPFSVWLAANAQGRDQILLRVFTTTFNVLALWLTGTRSSLLALLVLLPVLTAVLLRYSGQTQWSSWSRADRRLALAVVLVTLLGLGALPTGNATLAAEQQGVSALSRFFTRSQSVTQASEYTQGSTSVRLQMWRATLRMISDRPWSGVGAGAWEAMVPPYQAEGTQLETDYYVHNEFLQLLAEYGLVGWLALLGLLAYLCRAAVRTWRLGSAVPHSAQAPVAEAPWRAVALSSLLALLVVSQAGFPWRLATTGALMALCLAVLAASDLRLRPSTRLATPAPQSLWHWRLLGSVLLGCTLLGGFVAVQAARAEARLVQAVKMALTISAMGGPAAPEFEANKARMLALLREGIALNPHYRKITSMAADELARWDDWQNASWVWKSVLDSRPYVVALLSNLARASLKAGDAPQARAYLARAQAVQPQATSVRAVQILLCLHNGQQAEALALLHAALAQGDAEFDTNELAYTQGMQAHDWPLALQALAQRRSRWPVTVIDSWLKEGALYATALHDEARATQAYQQALNVTAPPYRERVRQMIPAAYRAQLQMSSSKE